MDQNEIVGRIKTTQNFVVWVSIFFIFLYLILPKYNNPIVILLNVFIIFFTYTLSGFYFIKLSGYVGKDISQFFIKSYKKHEGKIKKIMKFIGFLLGILVIGSAIYFIIKVPENYLIDRVIGISGMIVAIVLYFIQQRKNKQK